MTEFLRRARFCALCTACFSLLSGGYRYLSLSYSGDSTLISQAGEALYQIGLGRFLQPIYWQIRGTLVAPLLVGLFATAFLICSCTLIISLLGIKRKLHMALVCGLLTANETFAISNATYLPWTDVYALAMLFAVMGVYAFFRWRWGFLTLTPLCFMLSLGLYQSYLTTAATLFLLVLMCMTLRGTRTASIWITGMKACLSLLLGLLLYAFVLKLVLACFGLSASEDYNGVGRVAYLTPKLVLDLAFDAYLTPLRYLFDWVHNDVMPWHLRVMPAAVNLSLLALTFLFLLMRMRTLRSGARLTLLFLLLLMPWGMNFTQIISQGTLNGLMIYAYCFFYLLPIVCMPPVSADANPISAQIMPYVGRAAALLTAFVIAFGTVTANQLALKRDLEYGSTISLLSRMLDRAEQTQGYIPGETPVVVLGLLTASPLSMTRLGFADISGMQGALYNYSASYESAFYWFVQMVLGDPLLLVSHDERAELSFHAEELTVFPDQGSTQMIDGRLYIRLN